MKDRIQQEWDVMVANANDQLAGDCPLLEDAVVADVDHYIKQLESKVEYLKKVIKGGLDSDASS